MYEKVRLLFIENCDYLVPETSERALSFSRFIDLALQNKLFEAKATYFFLENIDPKEEIKCLEDLIPRFREKIEQIKIRLTKI